MVAIRCCAAAAMGRPSARAVSGAAGNRGRRSRRRSSATTARGPARRSPTRSGVRPLSGTRAAWRSTHAAIARTGSPRSRSKPSAGMRFAARETGRDEPSTSCGTRSCSRGTMPPDVRRQSMRVRVRSAADGLRRTPRCGARRRRQVQRSRTTSSGAVESARSDRPASGCRVHAAPRQCAAAVTGRSCR